MNRKLADLAAPKVLLFVMIDGWDLITRALVTSYT